MLRRILNSETKTAWYINTTSGFIDVMRYKTVPARGAGRMYTWTTEKGALGAWEKVVGTFPKMGPEYQLWRGELKTEEYVYDWPPDVDRFGHEADSGSTEGPYYDQAKYKGTLLMSKIADKGPGWMFNKEWRTSTAVALAKGINESLDFSVLPILADALQDAGCESEVLLTGLRGPSTMSWFMRVVYELLGKL